MAYTIEYFREGERTGTEVSIGTLEATQQAAHVGLKQRQADFVRIIDTEGGGAEVWSEGIEK